ncbi:MAG: hypothetical protein JJT78_07345 [Leptospira sp.]|nr:hypothetical protein [Leptospira sp.]
MAEKPQNKPYYILSEKRDILDIYDTYKYMNSSMLAEIFIEGIWDHGTGWAQLHYSSWDWRHRNASEFTSPYPEASIH